MSTSAITFPQIGSVLQATITGGAGIPSGTAVFPLSDALSRSLTAGTNAGNVNAVYSNLLSVGTGAGVTLDLTSLTDPVNGTINFGHVRSMKFTTSTSTGNVTIGGGTTPVIAALPSLQGGTSGAGTFLMDFPSELATSGANNLKLVSDTAATPVTVTIFGR